MLHLCLSLYVKDAAQAFLDWFSTRCPSGVYNIGGGELCITSIRQCLNMLRDMTDETQVIELEPTRQGDLWYFCCDINKALETFGWQPKVPLVEGLKATISYFEKCLKKPENIPHSAKGFVKNYKISSKISVDS